MKPKMPRIPTRGQRSAATRPPRVRGYAGVPNPRSTPQSPAKRGVGLGGALGSYTDTAGELGLLDFSHQFGYCEGLITMRAQSADANARHEEATITAALNAEFAHPTRGALVNTGTAAGFTQPNHGATRQSLVPSAIGHMLAFHRTIDPPTAGQELTPADRTSPLGCRVAYRRAIVAPP